MQIFFIRTIKEGYTGCPVIVRFIQRLFKIVLNITKHQSGIYLGTPIHRFNAFLYRTPDPFRTFIIEFILKSATPFPKCYLHKEEWTFDS